MVVLLHNSVFSRALGGGSCASQTKMRMSPIEALPNGRCSSRAAHLHAHCDLLEEAGAVSKKPPLHPNCAFLPPAVATPSFPQTRSLLSSILEEPDCRRGGGGKKGALYKNEIQSGWGFLSSAFPP